MKIVALGDIHGKDIWKKIVEKESDADKIVFLGDYVDTYDDIHGDRQLQNLKEIVKYKQENPDKVILLMGNHDYHYFPKCVCWGIRYSGYQGYMIPRFSPYYGMLIAEKVIQPCYVHDDIVFVHAGISNTWCKTYNIDKENLQESVNGLFEENISAFDFLNDPDKDREWADPYGNNKFQSPLWIRPECLLLDKIQGYQQVVGHTQMNEIDLGMPVKFIDTFNKSKQYLIIENNLFKIGETT